MNEQDHADTGLDDQKGTELKVSLVVHIFHCVINAYALLIYLRQERHCCGDSRYEVCMRHVCGVDTLGCYDRCA